MYEAAKRGSAKNPYDKSVYGIGYLGEENGKEEALMMCNIQAMLHGQLF